MRKAMSLATPSLSIKQYTDKAGKSHIDIDLTATAGIKGTELRTLDWMPAAKGDGVFGPMESTLLYVYRWKNLDNTKRSNLQAELGFTPLLSIWQAQVVKMTASSLRLRTCETNLRAVGWSKAMTSTYRSS